jgi:hypothetical protein
MKTFTFDLHDRLEIVASGQKGEVIARAEYANGEACYLLRYCAGNGDAVEHWWAESALIHKTSAPK